MAHRPSRMLSTKEAADFLGQSDITLRGWRCARKGPPFIVLGPRNVKYAESDLQQYVDDRRFAPSVRSTEDRHATR